MDGCFSLTETITRQQIITSKLPITYWENLIKFTCDLVEEIPVSGDYRLYKKNRDQHIFCVKCNLCLYCEPKCPCP